jgi:hypothetical protein
MWLSLASLSLSDVLLERELQREAEAVEVWLKNSASKGGIKTMEETIEPETDVRMNGHILLGTLNSELLWIDYTLAAAKGVFKYLSVRKNRCLSY